MASTKSQTIAGWVLTILLALFLGGVSAAGKFLDWEGKDEMLAKMGFTSDQLFQIGVIEVVVTLLFVIPRTSFLGAILLTAYLGGAVVTHLRMSEPVFMPIVIGVLVWIALALRKREIWGLACGCCGKSCAVDKAAADL